jgi:NAD(P)H-flavin reductase
MTKIKAVVRRVWKETPRLTGAVLEVPSEVAAAYRTPGQYVTVHAASGAEAKGTILVIASAVGEARGFELLVNPAAADKLKLEDGAQVEIDPPAGKGFSLDGTEGRDVLLFGVGTGIAALRPVVEALRARRSAVKSVTLFAGAHSAEEHPYRRDEESWRRDGVRVVRAVSRPWVQELFEKNPMPLDNAVAYLCGMKAMIEGTSAVLTKGGLGKKDIRLNW